jgi:Cu(I)/Ag(I) efflux system membrane fusion protein
MQALLRTAVLAVLALGCGPSPAPADHAADSAPSTVGDYYCPMHPSYRSTRPGNCPICGMQLVREPKPGSEATAQLPAGRAAVAIDAAARERIGLATSLVERMPFARRIRAAGRVDADERALSVVSLRFGGWIESLRVAATGDPIRAGDVLASVYAPELLEAERTYLAARKSLPDGDAVAQAARDRLLLSGLTEDQVRDLESRSEAPRTTEILARTSGVVTRRDAIQGKRFEAGETLFEIADLSTVWVTAEVYEEELPLVRAGMSASIEVAGTQTRALEGKVDAVLPTISETTRAARVRIVVPNPDGSLRPGAFATVALAADLGEQVQVDIDAVLETGTRELAYVETADGRFEPREVRLGARSSGRAVVLSGLEPGERVVSHATFLVDSESRLRSAASAERDTASEGHAGHR